MIDPSVERRLATAVHKMAEHIIDAPRPRTRRWGTVEAVNTGPPASVDVTMNGVTIPAVRYLAWYTPSVDDVVIVSVEDNDPIVLGPLA